MTTPLTLDTIRHAPKALLHDHLDGGLRPATVLDLAEQIGYDDLPATDVDGLATWFRTAAHSGSLERYLEPFAHTVGVMQTPEALHRVAYECVEDLAADNVVYAEIRFAPELHIDRGLSLDAVVDAVLAGFADGEKAASSEGRTITVRCLVTAMRHAARSLEIAELAIRFRDKGVVGFDIAGAEAGYPPTRHLDAFEYMRNNNARFTIHAGEAFGLPSIHEAIAFCGADRLGHGVRIVDDITVAPDGTVHLGRLAALLRDKRIPFELCPSSNVQTGAVASIAEHPFDLLARLPVPRHRQHRQPADERHHDEPGDASAGGGVRLRLERPGTVHDQRDEVGVHPVRRTTGDHRRGHQTSVRRADRLTWRTGSPKSRRRWA